MLGYWPYAAYKKKNLYFFWKTQASQLKTTNYAHIYILKILQEKKKQNNSEKKCPSKQLPSNKIRSINLNPEIKFSHCSSEL